MARFGMDLPTQVIEQQIATAVDLIVMSRRMADGSRFLTSLTGVTEGPSGEVRLHELVGFDELSRTWHLVDEPSFVGQGVIEGLLDEEEVRQWRSCAA